MCRMVGMVGRARSDENDDGGGAPPPFPSFEHLVSAPHSLRIQSEKGIVPPTDPPGHADSWGIGWFDRARQVSLLRQTGSAADSPYFVFAAEGAARGNSAADILIGHLRKASCGAVTSENAHPFRMDYAGTMLLAHNGTIRAPLLETLRADLADTDYPEKSADSDTIVLAAWLAHRIARNASTDFGTSLAGALSELLARGADDPEASYSAINLLIAHPTGLFALRQFSKNGHYYTLFARPGGSDEGAAWIVASEATDVSDTWTGLEHGHLYQFTSDGDARVVRLLAA